MNKQVIGFFFVFVMFVSCTEKNTTSQPIDPLFHVVDTDFSKGRLGYEQTIELNDLVKFHGHLCDGLVVGALGLQEAFAQMYPNQPIDRTNLRIVSKPSPCLTDVAVYLSGGRYQFNTFFVDDSFEGLYIVQRIDINQTYRVSLNPNKKPAAIDSLSLLAMKGELDPCGLDELRQLEDDFTEYLLNTPASENFTIEPISNFIWQPTLRNDFLKSDILNKDAPLCGY